MDKLLLSFFRALRSLFAPGMFGVFVMSLILTIAMLIAFVFGVSGFSIWLSGHVESYSLAHYLPWLGSFSSLIIAFFLFPGIMPVIVNFFDDRIALLIEQRDYPALAPVRQAAFWPELWHDACFSVLTVLLNILVLPLYLLPGFNFFLFYLLNGYLLGREFYVMAARRHMSVKEAEAMRRAHSGSVLASGIVLTILATIPIVNLFAPFWGIAAMVHLYHLHARSPVLITQS